MNDIIVVKRDGSKQPLDIQKIRDQIEFACRGINVNPLELESKISLSLKQNIKSSDIQELLINTAVSMVTVDTSDWSLVAGRMAMYQLHRQIYKNTKFEMKDFSEFLAYAKRNGLYRKDFYEVYTEEDIETLKRQFKEKYDFSMNIAQVLSLKSKYLLKNKRGGVEYPQFADMTSSMILASIENNPVEYTKEYFKMLSEMMISLATPFKANLRRENGNTGSCFIVPTGDDIVSIVKTWADMAMISKQGGGLGVYLGYLRPENAWSPNIPKANNVTIWTKIINDIAVAVNQRGVRKGAITPAVDWWHMDIHDFIELKSETGGDLRKKSFDIFPQVVVDDWFVHAVKENRDVYLFDQHELRVKHGIDIIPLVDDALWKAHETVEQLIEEGKLDHYTKINAKDLWKEFLRIWVETGDFYITHKDNLNLSNYLKEEGLVANSGNLCTESWSITKLPESWSQHYENDKLVTDSDGLYHSCSLLSINVGIIYDDETLERVCRTAVRMLDSSIELGVMPVKEADNSSFALRNIGIGTLGTADWMAYNKLSYEKEEDLLELEKMYEKIAWYCYNASIDLAKEKGSYPMFEKAKYDTLLGKPVEELNRISPNEFDWVGLSERIKQEGIRNFLLLATAPNTSSGILMGATASYLPPHSKMNYQTLADMSVPIVPRYIGSRFWYYKGKFQYPAHKLIEATRRCQRWIDTGISMEVPINPAITNIKQISDAILDGFINKELKAVYYSVTVDAKHEAVCADCAN